jgi:hypothetical protein
VRQLCLESLLTPTGESAVVLEQATTEAVVALMSEAIAAVFQQEGGVGADDELCPEP